MFALGVTKAEVVIDDSLFAISQPSSVAFIAKKNFVIDTSTEPFDPADIPEPTTMVLSLAALGGLGQALAISARAFFVAESLTDLYLARQNRVDRR